jgi:hypothetical protein
MALLGTDAIMTGLYSALPAAGLAGRLYWATDTEQLFRDSGVAWAEVKGGVSVRVYHDAGQNIPNATYTAITFNSESWDTHAMHDTGTNPTRLTCKVAGPYVIGAQVRFAFNAGGISRRLAIVLNGATYQVVTAMYEYGETMYSEVVTPCILAVNDYVEAWAYQDSGGNLSVDASSSYSPIFWAYKL